MGKRKVRGKFTNSDLPIGALVHAKIDGRVDELATIVDANYGYQEYTWYMVYGFDTNKIYFVYPYEITLISMSGKVKGGKNL